jgi:glycosyl transferase, family 25
MTHPLDAYERIYVINLPDRVDRRVEMADQLDRIGLVLGSPRVRLFKAVRPSDGGGFPSRGARGCFMSHLGVLREATVDRLARVLILEDDLNFTDDFSERAPAVLARAASPDCAIFYGGYELEPLSASTAATMEIPPDRVVRTTHFVGFDATAAGAAVPYLEAILRRPPGDPQGGPMHVDGAYSWLRRAHPELRTWAANPPLGHQRASRTDIHALRWFDRTPLVRDAVDIIRRARNR